MTWRSYLVQTSSRYDEAEQLLRRALAIHETSLGPSHAVVANTLSSLAQLLQATNRYGEAEPLQRRALTIKGNYFGTQHLIVAVSLHGLARNLSETNRLSEAEPLIRRALAIQEQSNPDHWSVVVALNNLAYLLMSTGRAAEAEPLFRRAWSVGEKALGADHWMIADLPNNLAMLLQEAKRFDEAEPLFRRALAISEKSLGSNHPTVARYSTIWPGCYMKLVGAPTPSHSIGGRWPSLKHRSAPNIRTLLSLSTSLAGLFAERGDWPAALALHSRAKPILTGRRGVAEAGDRSELAKARLAENSKALRAHARAAYRVDAERATGT